MASHNKFVRERAYNPVDSKNILYHSRVRKPVFGDLKIDGVVEQGFKTKKSKHTKEDKHPPRFSSLLTKKHRQADLGKSKKTPSSKTSQPNGTTHMSNLVMHKSLFQDGEFEGIEVVYRVNRQVCRKGKIQGNGIFCDHCKKEVSPSEFEKHAGWATTRKPYDHIHIENGLSLHDLSVKATRWRREKRGDKCSKCNTTTKGLLLCCDSCAEVSHLGCVKLSSFPAEDWSCETCIEKKQFNANGIAAGPMCALCSGHNFSKSEFGRATVILCDQCDRGYHVQCLKEHRMSDLKELPLGEWFCSFECNDIHSKLMDLVDSGYQPLPKSVEKKLEKKGSAGAKTSSITWRLLRGRRDNLDEEENILFKAVDILHERFGHIGNSKRRSDDLIPPMVFGKNIKVEDFRGMNCAVLRVNTKIVSVVTIRIFGKELAELPLVATTVESQGQGYFSLLFGCLLDKLTTYKVKKLVLHAATEKVDFWKKLGFSDISEEELMIYKKNYPLMEFKQTRMVQMSIGSENSKHN